jgi:hypothetical protein
MSRDKKECGSFSCRLILGLDLGPERTHEVNVEGFRWVGGPVSSSANQVIATLDVFTEKRHLVDIRIDAEETRVAGGLTWAGSRLAGRRSERASFRRLRILVNNERGNRFGLTIARQREY